MVWMGKAGTLIDPKLIRSPVGKIPPCPSSMTGLPTEQRLSAVCSEG